MSGAPRQAAGGAEVTAEIVVTDPEVPVITVRLANQHYGARWPGDTITLAGALAGALIAGGLAFRAADLQLADGLRGARPLSNTPSNRSSPAVPVRALPHSFNPQSATLTLWIAAVNLRAGKSRAEFFFHTADGPHLCS